MRPEFTENLLRWARTANNRPMPWKGEKDPYKVWLSESILQQTRVEQGWAYYEKFLEAFPSITDLAAAPEQQVFKLWEGLGYYSRCRNLIATARHISNSYNGVFPRTYGEIVALKGIGPYTAAAISSFCYDVAVPVVDGNVQRVIARYLGITTPVDSAAGKKMIAGAASELIDRDTPAAYNQAIMDFGAVICTPRNPRCSICVQQTRCAAFRNGTAASLPVKSKAQKKTIRWLYYFLLRHEGEVYIRKRSGKDIWQDLHEFYLLESRHPVEDPEPEALAPIVPSGAYDIEYRSDVLRQQLTHQTISGKIFVVKLRHAATLPSDYIRIKEDNLHAYAFPRFINSFLADHVYKGLLNIRFNEYSAGKSSPAEVK